jgi:hypothetical protein
MWRVRTYPLVSLPSQIGEYQTAEATWDGMECV